MHLETISRPLASVAELASACSPAHFANTLIAMVFAASAPVAIILGVGVTGGLTESDLASWLFAAFAINGVLTIVMSLLYRMPLAFFWTIPGTVLLGPALGHLSFPEVIGAFYATGLLLFLLGLTGSVSWIMKHLPMPIIMAMVAGVFLQFGLDWIEAFTNNIWVTLPMTVAFFAVPFLPGPLQRLPPMVGVLVMGIVALAMTDRLPVASIGEGSDISTWLVTPNIYTPKFSLAAMIELVIPLAITVLAAQNAQGLAILQSSGYRPPVNAITTSCGLLSMVTATFGSVSTCLTGPVNAILASSGEHSSQYVAAILVGLAAIAFGSFSPLFTELMLGTSPAFIATLAGLALLPVLQSAFKISFGGRFTLGALVTFLVTLADYSIYNIGAPFWGLIFGFLASSLLERNDFLTHET